MKKIMLFIMLFMAMAFADDSYFAKVAARDAEAAAERAEKAAMKTLEKIDLLTIQVINLRNDNIVMQKRLEEQIALNQYLTAVIINSKAVKDGVSAVEKQKANKKAEAERKQIEKQTALSTRLDEWRTCAQKYAIGQCTSTCTNGKSGLTIGYESQFEACRVNCENIQKNKCGIKPTAMKEERKSEAKAFGFCLFTKDSKLALL